MKKTFKGFTLIECIVALAILGVASLTMAQIYASVASKNRENHLVNTSLSNQMAYVEKYSQQSTEVIKLAYTGSDTDTPPHKGTGTGNYHVKIVSTYKDPTSYTYKIYNSNEYSFGVDLYVLKSRDADNTVYDDANDNPKNLRYKYLIGHGG